MVKRKRSSTTDTLESSRAPAPEPMSQDEKKSSSIALVQSVDLDDTRPQTDPKHYRLIQLSNGLQVMLISDPRAPSGPHVHLVP